MKLFPTITLTLILILFTSCSEQGQISEPSAKSPNVLLIIVDTLGAKHLGVYDSKLKHSPNLDRLGSEGVVFEQAISPAPWTKPAVASIFTGLLPSRHGVRALNSHLSPESNTLAERLKERGYQTAGFISHTFINDKNGYHQGFDRYEVFPFTGNVHKAISSEHVSNLGLEWLKQRESSSAPFFLFLHYFDPHYNYQHHPRFSRTDGYKGQLKPGMDVRKLRKLIPKLTPADREYLVNLYHEEIAFTDEQIGRVITALDQSGAGRDTLIIVTADHGEEFLEHGYIGHTRTLYDELIRVPLIIRLPGGVQPGRVAAAVSTLDITPTVLELVGGPAAGLDGISLLTTLRTGKSGSAPRDLISEVDFHSSGIDAYKLGLINNEWKFVLDKADSAQELLNRQRDPAEQKNILREEPARSSAMSSKVERYKSGVQEAGKISEGDAPKTPEEVEQLKSLGYM